MSRYPNVAEVLQFRGTSDKEAPQDRDRACLKGSPCVTRQHVFTYGAQIFRLSPTLHHLTLN